MFSMVGHHISCQWKRRERPCFFTSWSSLCKQIWLPFPVVETQPKYCKSPSFWSWARV